jgi:hypothetical protein
MAKISVDEVVDVAFAVEEGDPIDWGLFENGKEQSLKMIAASVVDQFDKEEWTREDRLIILSTITKLVTENFILHSKLLSRSNPDEV